MRTLFNILGFTVRLSLYLVFLYVFLVHVLPTYVEYDVKSYYAIFAIGIPALLIIYNLLKFTEKYQQGQGKEGSLEEEVKAVEQRKMSFVAIVFYPLSFTILWFLQDMFLGLIPNIHTFSLIGVPLYIPLFICNGALITHLIFENTIVKASKKGPSK